MRDLLYLPAEVKYNTLRPKEGGSGPEILEELGGVLILETIPLFQPKIGNFLSYFRSAPIPPKIDSYFGPG